MFCSNSVKNVIGNLIRIALNPYITFGSIVIFTILILLTQGHGISLHLFMSFLVYFISIWYFSLYSSFISLLLFFSHPVVSYSLQPHGLQYARPLCGHLWKLVQVHVHSISDTVWSSHPLMPSSPSFLNLSQHQEVFQWVSFLGRFISRYLIIFVAMVNGINSLISISGISLFV